jgi:hypothetical protein
MFTSFFLRYFCEESSKNRIFHFFFHKKKKKIRGLVTVINERSDEVWVIRLAEPFSLETGAVGSVIVRRRAQCRNGNTCLKSVAGFAVKTPVCAWTSDLVLCMPHSFSTNLPCLILKKIADFIFSARL